MISGTSVKNTKQATNSVRYNDPVGDADDGKTALALLREGTIWPKMYKQQPRAVPDFVSKPEYWAREMCYALRKLPVYEI
jgi:hypothetical protein